MNTITSSFSSNLCHFHFTTDAKSQKVLVSNGVLCFDMHYFSWLLFFFCFVNKLDACVQPENFRTCCRLHLHVWRYRKVNYSWSIASVYMFEPWVILNSSIKKFSTAQNILPAVDYNLMHFLSVYSLKRFCTIYPRSVMVWLTVLAKICSLKPMLFLGVSLFVHDFNRWTEKVLGSLQKLRSLPSFLN